MLGTGSIVPAKVLRCQLAAWQVAQSIACGRPRQQGLQRGEDPLQPQVSSGSMLTCPPGPEARTGQGRAAPAPFTVDLRRRRYPAAPTFEARGPRPSRRTRALWNSRFSRAMNFTSMPFGQAAWHS